MSVTHTPDREPKVTAELAAEHGLKPDEYASMLESVGRTPTLTELGIYSVMWSEHCSYKSSRVWLKKLPTTAPWVICGPGENAGVIDIGDGQAAIFKMESHNHPSFIEPYQGAATGVGGILRDVFTMGARPVANLNALRFGEPANPKTRHLVAGVVAGIGGYGNCVGVPTVGGETNFHKAYNGNCLVNAMTVGVAQTDKIFYSKAAGVGKPVVYVGSKTGRDGIHGATMSSAEFTEDSEAKRPTVQVGDPFTEKLLIEACLELMATDAIVAIQDMGAAGLTSSSVEMAGKGGLGIDLDLDAVPQREAGMTPYEIMLSESQERMLMILEPGREEEAKRIFDKWELDFAVIGKLTDNGRMVIRMHGHTWCDVELAPLFDKAPLYNRPTEPTPPQAEIAAADAPLKASARDTLLALMGTPDLASRRWIWEQYDSQVGADTMIGPGGDAALVRVHGTPKALAMTTDCTPRYCYADPVRGGAQAVAEAYRNIITVGALPLAITDNMNFGNPEKPRIMGQFAGCIEGMAEACRVLDFPVVSGNVSLYNETNGEGILPTPAIGGVGLLKDSTLAIGSGVKAEGDVVLLFGETKGHVGQSLYLREVHGREEGAPPPVDLAAERRAGDLVRGLIEARTLTACHDLADGGLAVGLAEMALRGKKGIALTGLEAADAGLLFGEDQGRYLVTVAAGDVAAVTDAAKAAGVPVTTLGTVGGDAITGLGGGALALADLREVHEGWLPGYMAGDA
ncbi:phosphoribosylformylglycinamidine synthase subunit PurL [Nitrospirillum amazonense]|uniref:Phosphoribosylformylglycinamidine synthase subunit PurL n=3 Tax=Azospirillaceae TaxID=2829815 RepID=A0A248JQL2_9PROT|nr:phosphoribosylformylglycinamidine synthase subunit PurL [Nitrospirillum amazonense]ASG20514.1 phosphoribosylformylglycinamidine synthase II [Nitrospirillum amazonense CBAmc]MEC4591225.1 phosphoribosylformylglycinamidine synthase subunit PurL [Nitrospirillum amazonense]TWB30786.1 phosphoribosylformylglycinamidine synthase subunit II [Nitrospirillum amazonense]TWB34113.1 phosphoribosylformylglycinamidine synthase subunit II [Nitrospirillum amazonense]